MKTMIEKLELRHLAGYLPYGLKIKTGKNVIRTAVLELKLPEDARYEITASMILNGSVGHFLILHPLSDLIKEIEVNGKKFVPEEYLNENYKKYYLPENWNAVLFVQSENIFSVNYAIIQKLYEWHFDIHNLIESNLAIDINTLQS